MTENNIMIDENQSELISDLILDRASSMNWAYSPEYSLIAFVNGEIGVHSIGVQSRWENIDEPFLSITQFSKATSSAKLLSGSTAVSLRGRGGKGGRSKDP